MIHASLDRENPHRKRLIRIPSPRRFPAASRPIAGPFLAMPTVKERPAILEAGVEARFDSDETSRALGKPIFDLTPTWAAL